MSLPRQYAPYGVILAVATLVYITGGLEPVDRAFLDARFRLVDRPSTGAVTLVSADTGSLVDLEIWPWPAAYHAAVIDNLLVAGAERVAFTVDLASASDADDLELERVVAEAGPKLILPAFASHSGLASRPGNATGTARTLPRPSRHARLATVRLDPDADGRIREYRRGDRYLSRQVPSLAVAMVDDSIHTSGSYHVDYGIDLATIPTISYSDVLRGQFDPALVRGRAILVGATAVELAEHLPVPRYGRLPATQIQALAAESLAQSRDLVRPGAALGLVLALLATLWAAWSTERLAWRTAAIASAAGLVGLLLFVLIVQLSTRSLIDVSAPVLVLLLTSAHGFVREKYRKRTGLLVMNRQIRQTETLMRHVVVNSFDAIVTLQEDGTITTFNRVAQKMFGYAEKEALGRDVSDLVRLPHAEARASRGAEVRNYRALYETEGQTQDGRVFPIELAVTWMVAGGVRRRVMFMRDITERKAQQEALRYQATHDSLTDLPNRNLLQERVEHALVAARRNVWPVALLLLDLDRFKEINDTLGHHIGDILLRKIARRLQAAIREADTIARLGGDEFAVLLPATGLDQARQMAQQLIQSLEEPFQVEGLSLQVDTSVGITMYPEHGTAAPALIRRADVAMYVAKRERCNVAIYDPEQDFTSIRLLALTGDLRRAIQDARLELHYQPKISAGSGRPIGVEALTRWRHPEHGDIPPDEFIGLAEHSGLIRPLTQWVLETALRQCAAWQREGIELSVSVNLSARNLLDEELPRHLLELLRSTSLPMRKLTLEITESVIMEDPQRAREVLTELNQLGISISIDDFGTGYSSLGYLRKLPATELKIDKSFVQEMDRQPEDRKIVHSTIELAHNLGLRVVAEGVETLSIWEQLKRLGCDFGQGYYFSRPVPAEALAEWYRETVDRAEESVASGDT